MESIYLLTIYWLHQIWLRKWSDTMKPTIRVCSVINSAVLAAKIISCFFKPVDRTLFAVYLIIWCVDWYQRKLCLWSWSNWVKIVRQRYQIKRTYYDRTQVQSWRKEGRRPRSKIKIVDWDRDQGQRAQTSGYQYGSQLYPQLIWSRWHKDNCVWTHRRGPFMQVNAELINAAKHICETPFNVWCCWVKYATYRPCFSAIFSTDLTSRTVSKVASIRTTPFNAVWFNALTFQPRSTQLGRCMNMRWSLCVMWFYYAARSWVNERALCTQHPYRNPICFFRMEGGC